MIDQAKELARLNVELADMRGIREGMELMLQGVDIGRGQHAQKFRDAMTTMFYMLEAKLQAAEHSAHALQFGRYCEEDPRSQLKLVS